MNTGPTTLPATTLPPQDARIGDDGSTPVQTRDTSGGSPGRSTGVPPGLPSELDTTLVAPHWSAWRVALVASAAIAMATPMVFVSIEGSLGVRGAIWWSAFACFVLSWIGAHQVDCRAGMTVLASAGAGGRARVLRIAFLVVQSLSAIGANWAVPTVLPGVATGGVLMVIVAAQLGSLPLRVALPWVAVLSAALLGIYLSMWSSAIAWTAGSAYAAFQLGMLGVSRLAERERTLREELSGIVAELGSTRALLESSVLSAERIRISRELHDLLGHHLVALGLQLEAATLDAEEPLRSRVAHARALARLLLADVRSAVSDLREESAIDLGRALRALETPGVGPAIDVRVEEDLAGGDPALASTLLRCAQEAVTNARRHAGATRITIEGTRGTLRIVDDGRGISPAALEHAEGSGLRGMRERVAAVGGSMSIRRGSCGIEGRGRGTEIVITLPREDDR